MADYTITVSGVDEAKLQEAVGIATQAVRGALEEAGLGELDVDVTTVEEDDTAV